MFVNEIHYMNLCFTYWFIYSLSYLLVGLHVFSKVEQLSKDKFALETAKIDLDTKIRSIQYVLFCYYSIMIQRGFVLSLENPGKLWNFRVRIFNKIMFLEVEKSW